MKKTHQKLLPFLLVMLFISCKKEEIDPLAYIEVNKLKGVWKMDKIEFIGYNEQQKKAFSNDNFIFFDLIGRSAMVPLNTQGSISVSGSFQIGNVFWGLRYEFDVVKKTFYKMSISSTEEFYKNNLKYPEESQITSELLDGEWEIITTGNTMTAKQISNKRSPKAKINFTATKQK